MRLAAVVTVALALTASASGVPTVGFEPSFMEVEQGAVFDVGIRVDAGTDTLTCFLVEFAFDAGVVELLSAEEGTLFAESGHATMFDWDTICPGLHSCNDVVLGYDSFVMCPGELVHLQLLGAEEGETALAITAIDLRDIRRERILPVNTADGYISVGPGTGLDGSDGEVQGPSLSCRPNPFSRGVLIDVDSCDGAEQPVIIIHDVSGRVVARPTLDRAAGSVQYWWSGEAHDGRPLPSGVYFVTAGGHSWQARERVTLIR